MLEFNPEPDVDFATGGSTHPDVVGDWFFSLAKDRTTHAPLRIANIHLPRRIHL
jgi:hypothetical protein